ncbi:spore germination protein [Paenibacillus filicis]|uniref:Spore germination protein n=1 Tax=Paenibacillus filicis TaxID=669464 RepID=A0ABU9DTA4_9BACL
MKLQQTVYALVRDLGRPADLKIDWVRIPGQEEPQAAVIALESITDRNLLYTKLIDPIQNEWVSKASQNQGHSLPGTLSVNGRAVPLSSDAMAAALFEGEALFLMHNRSEAIAVAMPNWNNRSVSEPERESTLIGPKDTFIEDLFVNISMIRRRIRDKALSVEEFIIGQSSKSKVMILSMRGLVNEKALEEFRQRLSAIRMDEVLDTTQIAYLVVDQKYTPFPMFQATERPDKAVSALMEGRFIVISDTTPTVLILPVTMTCLYETSDDYYFPSISGTFLRWVRLIGLAITLFLPALYIAITSINQDMFRIQFMLAVGASREGVPYPVYVEVVIMLILIELINEATVRLPKTIGGTATIVGGLIIGTAAAQSHLISYIMIVITATTAIGSYTAPNYMVGLAWRLCSFALVLLAIPWGLYGIVVGAGLIGMYLCSLESFGIPYTAPFSTFRYRDLFRDGLTRAAYRAFSAKPSTYSPQAGGKQSGLDASKEDQF